MRRLRVTAVVPVLLGALVLSLASPAAAKKEKKEKGADRAWTHPELASFGVDRIAMLPVASYNGDFATEKLVEGAVAQALRESGYRWISAGTTRDQLRSEGHGDSLLKLVKQSLLKQPRVDSLAAPDLCTRLRCHAVLSVRVDQFEQRQIEPGMSGKPSTTIQLKAALVDSAGALLWTVATSETAEGPYHEANTNPTGIARGDLGPSPDAGLGGAPVYIEVLTTICKRWATLFPAKSVPKSAP